MTLEMKVEVAGLDEARRKLGKPPDLRGPMHGATHYLRDAVIHTISERDIIFERGFMLSIGQDVQGTGANVVGLVGSDQVYAPVIEYGRRPGRFPPVAAMEYWVEHSVKATAIRIAHGIKAAAYLVGRAIATKGSHGWPIGRRVFRDTLEREAERVQQFFADAVEEWLK